MTRIRTALFGLLTLGLCLPSLDLVAAARPSAGSDASLQGCNSAPGMSARPGMSTPPEPVTLTAHPFAPGTTVIFHVRPPFGWSFDVFQVSATTGSDCRASAVITIEPCATCPQAMAWVNASGTPYQGGRFSGQLTSSFEIRGSEVVQGTPISRPTRGTVTATRAATSIATTALPTVGPGGAAPVEIQQTLRLVSGPPLPQVGQTNSYEHVIRMRNTTSAAMDRDILATLLEIVATSRQGQGINMSFVTDYDPGSRIIDAHATTGTVTVRGTSVQWEGELQAGQSLELRTILDLTPQTALSLNQPIRGQTINARDVRGSTLSVQPPPVPQLPAAQRIVQPPFPPIDPIAGDRYFADSGFGIGDDRVWTYYVRRGGRKTFGAPISRLFLLWGMQVQVFERGLLAVDASDNVVSLNLLEEPFLPYEAFGELRLPQVDDDLVASAPDPSAPSYGDEAQEFLRLNVAEAYDGRPTRFYSTFLSTVLYSDAYFLGPGDSNLLAGFALEIWGLPTSAAAYHVIGYDVFSGAGPSGEDVARPIFDTNVVLQRFQRGVMRFDEATATSGAAEIGIYLKAVLIGEVTDPELLSAAASSPLWAQYNPEGDPETWVDRPDSLRESNLVLAFEPD